MGGGEGGLKGGVNVRTCDDFNIAALTVASIVASFGRNEEGIWRSSCTWIAFRYSKPRKSWKNTHEELVERILHRIILALRLLRSHLLRPTISLFIS